MSTIQNKPDSPASSRRKSRSQSIPKPPSIPPPPVPTSSTYSDRTMETGIGGERLRTASESVLSPKAVRIPSNTADGGKRSVSFSRTRNPRSRTSTGKGILKKPKDETDQADQVTKEALDDAREKCEDRGRKLVKRKRSRKSKSGMQLENKGESLSKSGEKLSQVVLPVLSPAAEAGKENSSPLTDQVPKEEQNHSIFSHLGKTESDFLDHILKVRVHGADELITDLNVRNPLVRVSLIDTKTGKYVTKSRMERKVTSANESDYLSAILPALTQPYSFGTLNSNEPKWDEELIFNEDYLHVLQPNVIIGFEILNLIKSKRLLSRETDGWNKIAWGFIKVIGKNGRVNTEQKIRLQLFNYPWILPWSKKQHGESNLFHAYKSARTKYPSTLYITVSGIPKMDVVPVKSRPRYPTEVETGRMTLNQMIKCKPGKKGGLSRSLLNVSSTEQWRYKKGHPFKLPNKILYGIDCGIRGAFSCSFSNSGLYLAIACVGPNSYPIKVYDTFNGERIATLEGHQDLVYEMSWSLDDTELISASSDSTVRIWGFADNGSVFNVGIIPHSSYIYTAVYHPLFANDKKVVLTAGHDGSIRSWEYNSEAKTKIFPKLTNTIIGHKSYINSLVFDDDGQKLYSADSTGYIKVWDASINEEQQLNLKCITSVDIFYGIPISHLSIHFASRKILVQTSSNTLHILDSRILKVLTHIDPMPKPYFKKNMLGHTLPPLPNPMHSLFKRSQFSPCGTYILSGAAVYETDSGDKCGIYDSHGSVIDVAWHPNDFMCCLVEYGSCRTNVYTYDASCKPLKNPQTEAVKKIIKPNEVEKDRWTPLKPSVSENFLKALTQLKLGEDLFSSPKMDKFEGLPTRTVGI